MIPILIKKNFRSIVSEDLWNNIVPTGTLVGVGLICIPSTLASGSEIFLAEPGAARGCCANTLVINSVSHPFPVTALRRRHAQMD